MSDKKIIEIVERGSDLTLKFIEELDRLFEKELNSTDEDKRKIVADVFDALMIFYTKMIIFFVKDEDMIFMHKNASEAVKGSILDYLTYISRINNDENSNTVH